MPPRSRAGAAPARSGTAGRYPAIRTLQGTVTTPRSGGRTQQGTRPSRREIERQRNANIGPSNRYYELRESRAASSPAPRQPANAPSQRAGGRTQQRRSRITTSNRGIGKGGRAPTGNYQPVILGEFVGVILIIATSPVARGKAAGQVSPYAGTDMVKLAAATLLYMVLAFVSVASQNAARIAAWMGGLVLIAVGLAEGANVAKEIGLFTGGLAAAAAGQPSGGSQLSQGEITAAELQAQGNVQAINEGQGLGAIASQGLQLPPSIAGPQGVPISYTGQGKPL